MMASRPVVLVVDDDRLMRLTLRHKLTREGYRVDVAETGSQAIDRLCRFSYDLVLTDLRLPDVSGIEVVRNARRIDPSTPVILLTGSEDEASADRALEAGAVAIVYKPCKLAQVTVEAKKALARRRAAPPA